MSHERLVKDVSFFVELYSLCKCLDLVAQLDALPGDSLSIMRHPLGSGAWLGIRCQPKDKRQRIQNVPCDIESVFMLMTTGCFKSKRLHNNVFAYITHVFVISIFFKVFVKGL